MDATRFMEAKAAGRQLSSRALVSGRILSHPSNASRIV
jgi:hypothetical protein